MHIFEWNVCSTSQVEASKLWWQPTRLFLPKRMMSLGYKKKLCVLKMMCEASFNWDGWRWSHGMTFSCALMLPSNRTEQQTCTDLSTLVDLVSRNSLVLGVPHASVYAVYRHTLYAVCQSLSCLVQAAEDPVGKLRASKAVPRLFENPSLFPALEIWEPETSPTPATPFTSIYIHLHPFTFIYIISIHFISVHSHDKAKKRNTLCWTCDSFLSTAVDTPLAHFQNVGPLLLVCVFCHDFWNQSLNTQFAQEEVIEAFFLQLRKYKCQGRHGSCQPLQNERANYSSKGQGST